MLDRVLFPVIASFQDDKRRMGDALEGDRSRCDVDGAAVRVRGRARAEIIGVVLGPKWHPVVAPMQGWRWPRLSHGLQDRRLARLPAGTVYKRAWRQAIYAAMVVTGTSSARSGITPLGRARHRRIIGDGRAGISRPASRGAPTPAHTSGG
jgi:hypothetical protein